MEIENIVRKTIIDLKPYTPGKPIEEVKRELGLDEVFKLASNENPVGPSPKAIGAINTVLNNLNRYPDASCFYLKEKLAKFWKLDIDNFIIGNGSDEIIALTLKAFLNPGEEVIISNPTFLMYEILAKIEGAVLKVVAMKNFRYDLDAIKKSITDRTKIIFIANPDNPCGTYVNKKEVEDFVKGISKEIVLFFDEAYYEFMDVVDYPDTVSFINERPCVVSRTFSKVYGLAGLRVGYGIATPEVIQCLGKVKDPFNVNSLAQAAALSALDDQDFVQGVVRLTKNGREYLFKEFKRMDIEYIESYTNCILVKIGDKSGELCEYLLKNGIIIRNMAAWGLYDYIRVSIGLENENEKLIVLIEEFLKKEEKEK
ncbi:MAG: histidinol-phosphate transaminase [Candidatus Saelkia tenebricola]|nr:histidinol-phosphate transaminase [Candidatus Saelkia tenebricola]